MVDKNAIVPSETPSIIMLDENHAAIVVHNVETLTKSFKTWLKEEVDYTRTLFGRSGKPSLLDPGAHKLTSFFQAYPETHILEHIEDTTPGRERVKYVVRADITHVSGIRIGSGVGSCTTDESKYRYRWLTESKIREHGYTPEQIEELPSRERAGRGGGRFTVYRIRNPDILDLDNTILKMASKRAEVDATLSLPGVSGVFTQDIDKYPDALGDEKPPRKKVESKTKPVKKKPKKKPPVKAPEEPVVDPDEERVKTTLASNDIPMDDFTIYKWLKKVRLVPKPEFPQENFEAYNDALTDLLKAEWVANEGWWEIPC